MEKFQGFNRLRERIKNLAALLADGTTSVSDKLIEAKEELSRQEFSLIERTTQNYVPAEVRTQYQISEVTINPLTAHSVECDVFSCAKEPCFEREPDKIVSDTYQVERKPTKAKMK